MTPTFKLYFQRFLRLMAAGIMTCSAWAEDIPDKYVFELSDEPVKVHAGTLDTKSVFFPKYARGTSPEALKQQAEFFQSQEHNAFEVEKSTIKINLSEDQNAPNQQELTGYEFHYAPHPEDMVIATVAPDEENWLNDGDADSPFFHTEERTTNTKSDKSSIPPALFEDSEETTLNLNISLPETIPHPLGIQPGPSSPIRTVIKSRNGDIVEMETSLTPAREDLPPGYVPIPALPEYQPTFIKKLK